VAIYRFSAAIISRAKGRSSVAAAAYRSGAELVDERTGAVHDYTRKSDIQHSEIMAPEGAPGWSLDRPALWNAVEAGERRKDAQLAREVQLALPRELDADRQIALLRGFVRDEFVARGMVADFSLHDHVARDGGEQPHAHVMLTMRSIDGEGFGLKVREWNSDELLVHWRERWAEASNEVLAETGVDARIDHRTLAAQRDEATARASAEPEGERRQALEGRAAEMDREPSPYMRASWYMEQKARQAAEATGREYEPVTERGQWFDAVRTIAEEKLAQVRELVTHAWEKTVELTHKLLGTEPGRESRAEPASPRERAEDAVQRWREARERTAEADGSEPASPQDRAADAVQRWRELAAQRQASPQAEPPRPAPSPRPDHDPSPEQG
jgi:hypothetical protein